MFDILLCMEQSAADSLKNIVDAKYIYAALQVEH